MLFQETNIREREDSFYKNLIRLYLKYGSVDEVFRRTRYSLPISYPGMHHLIKRWGIVKSAGPNSKLSEALTVLTLLSDNQIPLEKLYKQLPPSFKTSLSTLHRILHNVKEGVVRRYGTALVITSGEGDVLVGNDADHGRNVTIPMTYSIHNENPEISIKRVMQQEVFSEMAVEKNFPEYLIPENPKPFMFLDIADIKVAVYSIYIKKELYKDLHFSSYKVFDYKFESVNSVLNLRSGTRTGVKDILNGYNRYLLRRDDILSEVSEVNLALLKV